MTKTTSRYLLLFLLLATAFLYYPALDGAFTFMDDNTFIVENQNIQSLDIEHIKAIFTSREVGHYHPVTSLFYAIEIHFSGLNPFWFHLNNLILHLINIVLVFTLVSKLFKNNLVSILSCTLFAIHPMMVESVSWAAARSTLLFSSFYLLGLISYFNFLVERKKIFYILTFLLFILSILSKSAAISFPAMLLLLHLSHNKKEFKQAITNSIPFFLVAIASVIITLKMAHAIGTAGSALDKYTLIDRFFMVNYAIAYYLSHTIWPFKLSALHFNPIKENGLLPSIYYASTIITPLFIYLGYLIYKYRDKVLKHPIFIGSMFFLISIGLYLQIYPIGDTIVSERYIYLPIIGLCILIGFAFEKIMKKSQLKIPGIILVLIIISALSFKTSQRIPVWKNNLSLWENITTEYPNHFYGYYGLACSYFDKGDFNKAVVNYKKAIERKPDYTDAYVFHGKSLSKLGQDSLAASAFSQAIDRKHRNISEMHELRANAYTDDGKFNQALADWNTFIDYEPQNWQAYNARAQIKINIHDSIGAINDWTNSIGISPNRNAFFNRALTFARIKKNQQAINDLTKAIHLAPQDGQIYYVRGLVLQSINKQTEACADFKRASQLGHAIAKQTAQQSCHQL